jgi:DNA invertase Pin-like site-specific DNA recombinase
MKCAAYIRVSTPGQGYGLQVDEIRRAAKARGDKVTRWFHEKASAGSLDRPKLAELRAAVRAGEVQRVYIWRIDRLVRSGIRDALTVLHEFRDAGCSMVTIRDPFPLDGAAADLIFSFVAWLAEEDGKAIAARITAARARARARGEPWGRPRRVVDIARARELRKTRSLRDVAVALKVPRATLARALQR